MFYEFSAELLISYEVFTYLNPFYGHYMSLVSHSVIFFKIMLYEYFIVNIIYYFSFHLLALDFITATIPWRPGGKFFFYCFPGALCEWDVWNIYTVVYFVINCITEAKCAWIIWWFERHIPFWKFVLGNDSFISVKFRLILLVLFLAVLILWSSFICDLQTQTYTCCMCSVYSEYFVF
jgi:hypothetical protein